MTVRVFVRSAQTQTLSIRSEPYGIACSLYATFLWPGARVNDTVILLNAGTKATQSSDILLATRLAEELGSEP